MIDASTVTMLDGDGGLVYGGCDDDYAIGGLVNSCRRRFFLLTTLFNWAAFFLKGSCNQNYL